MAEELAPAELEGELVRDRHVVPRADRGERVRHIEQDRASGMGTGA